MGLNRNELVYYSGERRGRRAGTVDVVRVRSDGQISEIRGSTE